MAGDLKQKYGTSNQTITLTVASLANNGLRECTAVDNSSNLYIDALVGGKVKAGAASTSATGYINVYAYGTTDGGTTYSGSASGTDADYSGNSLNLIWLGRISVIADATTYEFGPFSIASAFKGTLPDHWGIVIENKTGGTLDSTGGSHAVHYQGVYQQYT